MSRSSWKRIPAPDFDVVLTLESGQFFRYSDMPQVGRRACRAFLLLTRGRAIELRQARDTLTGAPEPMIHFRGATEEEVRRLLGLSTEHDAALRALKRDPVLREIVAAYPGLRLMRQDLHEAILGFICSSQSNIPKIRMNLQLLSQHCGQETDGHFHLPAPGAELDHALVREAKTGYRAKFLVATNRQLDQEGLARLIAADYAQSHAMLCRLPGIGPKIADCVCLFALGHGEAFPVDVHIARAMRELFPGERFKDEAAIKRFAQQRWGTRAGLAQQYIFQWARDNLRAERRPRQQALATSRARTPPRPRARRPLA